MAKIQFAKIIELDDNQVLITKINSTDEDKYNLVIRTSYEGFTAQISAEYTDENVRDADFDKYDSGNATAFIESINHLAN